MDTTAKIAALIGVRAHLAAKVERMNAKLATLDAGSRHCSPPRPRLRRLSEDVHAVR